MEDLIPTHFIVPLDLKAKREARRMTQQELAQQLDISRVHVARLETGARGLSFVLALKSAKVFGSLKLRYGNDVFVLSIADGSSPNGGRDIPTTEDHEEFNGVEHVVHTRNEMAEGVRALETALSDVRCWCGRSPSSREDRIRLTKELLDAKSALDGILQEIAAEQPDVFEDSRRLHLRERGLLEEAEDNVEPAA